MNSERYDVLLISPWTDEIKVSPVFHLMRKEIEKCSEIILQEKLPELNELQDGLGKDVLQYYEKVPLSIGLLSIASVLRKNGYKVKYVPLDYYKDSSDLKWFEKVLEQELKHVNYMVGVTSVTPEINRALHLLSLAKKIRPELVTVIGGTHVSYLEREYAKLESVDFVSRGEGEYTITELLNAVINKTDFENIDGLTYENGGKLIRTKDRMMCDLTQLPDIAFDLLPQDKMDRFKYHTYFSRGCYNNCDYCVEGKYFGSAKRFRSVTDFVNELERFCNEYKWKYIHIFDSDFIQKNSYINQICDEIINRKLKIILSINISPLLYKMIDLPLLKKMVKAGFKEFLIGSETADDKIINALNRHQTYDNLLNTTKMLKEAGAPIVSTYWVVGLPGETRESLLKTIESVDYLFRNELIYHGSAKLFVPYPGTKIFNKIGDYGIRLINKNWENFDRYAFPPAYVNENISIFELYEFMNLFHAMQLSYFTKRAGRIDDCYYENHDLINQYFVDAIYL